MLVYEHLKSLCQARRKHAAFLYFREAIDSDDALAKRFNELVSGSNGVLDREIDPDSTDWRHRVGSIPDAEKPWSIPLLQSIHSDT